MSQELAENSTRGFPGLATSSFLSNHPASKIGWDEGRWERDEGQRDAKMTLGLVLVEGWRGRSPKPTSHHPGPQPPWSSRCLPWAPGAGAGALPTLGGL